jgi:putative tricarboxylic transport membrane protein
MAWKDRLSGIFILLFAGVTLLWGLKLPVGRMSKPGPGLFPLLLSGIIALLAIFLISKSYASRKAPAPVAQEKPANRWAVLYLLGDLCLYVFLFRPLGFILSTFLCLLLLKPVLQKKWSLVLIGSLVVSLTFFFFFFYLLKVELPMGILAR